MECRSVESSESKHEGRGLRGASLITPCGTLLLAMFGGPIEVRGFHRCRYRPLSGGELR